MRMHLYCRAHRHSAQISPLQYMRQRGLIIMGKYGLALQKYPHVLFARFGLRHCERIIIPIAMVLPMLVIGGVCCVSAAETAAISALPTVISQAAVNRHRADRSPAAGSAQSRQRRLLPALPTMPWCGKDEAIPAGSLRIFRANLLRLPFVQRNTKGRRFGCGDMQWAASPN